MIAASSWWTMLISLGMLYRKVAVDVSDKTVSIYSRYLWLIRLRRAIPFADVRAVTYGYDDDSGDYDWFRVGLRLADDSELHLFNFVGEGTFITGGSLPSWMCWDEFEIDFSGGQEKESRLFVNVVSKIINVCVVPPRIY